MGRGQRENENEYESWEKSPYVDEAPSHEVGLVVDRKSDAPSISAGRMKKVAL